MKPKFKPSIPQKRMSESPDGIRKLIWWHHSRGRSHGDPERAGEGKGREKFQFGMLLVRCLNDGYTLNWLERHRKYRNDSKERLDWREMCGILEQASHS
jgi:hypothetical protein